MYELVIVWSDGDKSIYAYDTEQDAENGAANMRMVFGNQITWAGIRPKIAIIYRGYEIKKVNAVNKRTGQTVEAYKSVGKIVATLTQAKQNIDLFRVCNIKERRCKA